MTAEEVKAILEQHGFAHRPSSLEGMGSSYSRPSVPGWKIGAYASWRDPAHVSVGLTPTADGETVGTSHRFFSAAALQNQLAAVIANLEAMTATPDLMKCPDCRVRWVSVKESNRGSSFLSCQGMRMAGKKPNRGIECRGISHKIPPVLEYR